MKVRVEVKRQVTQYQQATVEMDLPSWLAPTSHLFNDYVVEYLHSQQEKSIPWDTNNQCESNYRVDPDSVVYLEEEETGETTEMTAGDNPASDRQGYNIDEVTDPNRDIEDLNKLINLISKIPYERYFRMHGTMNPSVSKLELMKWIKSQPYGLPHGGSDLVTVYRPASNFVEWSYKVHTPIAAS